MVNLINVHRRPWIDLSINWFDWCKLLVPAPEKGLDASVHVRLVGLGLDYRLSQVYENWSFSFGLRRFLNLAAGMRGDTTDRFRNWSGDLSPESLYKAHHYIELELLGQTFSVGYKGGVGFRARLFLNGFGRRSHRVWKLT